ncbi:hypothetical protein, partial [Lentihominibacter faecis]|uniref:hypothetical protein n=1 Tax=Lentihominibacter faecis TaxID=2764712 RepID=UPI002016734E
TANYLWDTPVGADENSVFSKNERGSEILGVSSTPTFLTEPKKPSETLKFQRVFVILGCGGRI